MAQSDRPAPDRDSRHQDGLHVHQTKSSKNVHIRGKKPNWLPKRPPEDLLSMIDSGSISKGSVNAKNSPTKLELIAQALSAAKKKEKEEAAFKPKEEKPSQDRILYARQKPGRSPVIGGTPISEEVAISLRTVVFGTAMAPLRSEWTRTGLGPRGDGEYLLRAPRNTTRGLLTAVQAELIKFLLFDRSAPKGEPPDRLLNADSSRLQEGLLHAICSMIWRAAEKTSAIICLPQEKIYLYQSMEYFQDGITEKLHTFEVNNYDDLEIMVKRYAHLFLDDPGPGALLLLYTCILSRGTQKIISDMDGTRPMLVGAEDEGSLCIVTLMLTGRATPYLHNGLIYVGDEDHYAVPRFGILSRSEIGFLVHADDLPDDVETNIPGSRLKTPSLPVWVVYTGVHFGVVYNTNRELLHNYHAERRFDLIYLTCSGTYYHLTVDTRQAVYSTAVDCEEVTLSSISGIEKVIQTKWPDAHVVWNNPNTNKAN